MGTTISCTTILKDTNKQCFFYKKQDEILIEIFNFTWLSWYNPAETNQNMHHHLKHFFLLSFFTSKKNSDETTWTLGHLWILSLFFSKKEGKEIEKKKFLSNAFYNLTWIFQKLKNTPWLKISISRFDANRFFHETGGCKLLWKNSHSYNDPFSKN